MTRIGATPVEPPSKGDVGAFCCKNTTLNGCSLPPGARLLHLLSFGIVKSSLFGASVMLKTMLALPPRCSFDLGSITMSNLINHAR
jgi:hypothetical protein